MAVRKRPLGETGTEVMPFFLVCLLVLTCVPKLSALLLPDLSLR
jgi:hypothetical protein